MSVWCVTYHTINDISSQEEKLNGSDHLIVAKEQEYVFSLHSLKNGFAKGNEDSSICFTDIHCRNGLPDLTCCSAVLAC